MELLQETTDNAYQSLLNLAILHYRHTLSGHHIPTIKPIWTTVDNHSRIQLPDDCVAYTKISILLKNRLWTLSLDPRLAMRSPAPCLDNSPTSDEEADGVINSGVELGTIGFFPFWWNGQYYPDLTAAGGGWNENYYRVDMPNRVIYLDKPMPGRQVCIEYISDGISVNAGTLVPAGYLKPLYLYLRYEWWFMQNDQRWSKAEADYKQAVVEADWIVTSMTVEEAYDAVAIASGWHY
jgi:hypothetical protein